MVAKLEAILMSFFTSQNFVGLKLSRTFQSDDVETRILESGDSRNQHMFQLLEK